MQDVFGGAVIRVLIGATWTTDAPFRETAAAIAFARSEGILGVEMEAAALYAFAEARGKDVVCFAHITNQMAVTEGDFEKGLAGGSHDALQVISLTARGSQPEQDRGPTLRCTPVLGADPQGQVRSMEPIYFDYNATTPVDPRVLEAMLPYLREQFGNPSSSHAYGLATHAAVERARGQVAALLGCSSEEIVFTGGGSEADNLAIKGIAEANHERGDHIITTPGRASGRAGDVPLPGASGVSA